MRTFFRICFLLGILVVVGLSLDFAWTQKTTVLSPSARTQIRLAFDQGLGQVILFGGSASGTLMNDTWIWDGGVWAEAPAINRPLARVYHSMAYDSARAETVLFGGYNPALGYTSGMNDTWAWDGTAWTQKLPPVSPSPRELAAMTFDQNLQKILLFGGGVPNTSPYYNQTWIWDGATWLNAGISPSPAGRKGAEMVFDEANGVVVLFGGMNASGQFLNDTWIWDGVSWTLVNPPHKPAPRWKFGLYYDSAAHRVICFGGHGASFFNDIWAWDGLDWEQVLTDSSPAIRFGLGMAYDAVSGEGLLFGGYNGTYLSDTWALKIPNQSPLARCKDIVLHANDQCQAFIIPADVDGGSYDPEGAELTYELDYSGPFQYGEVREVRLTVIDTDGATDSCLARVQVVDTTAPLPDVPALPALTGSCSVQVGARPTAQDACAGRIIGTTLDPLVYEAQGTYTITWIFSDGHGNEARQTQSVIVSDVTAPVLSLTDPKCIVFGNGKGNLWNYLKVQATDDCSGSTDLALEKIEIFNKAGNRINGDGILTVVGNEIYVNPLGEGWSIRITAMGTDSHGNPATSTFTKKLLKCKT